MLDLQMLNNHNDMSVLLLFVVTYVLSVFVGVLKSCTDLQLWGRGRKIGNSPHGKKSTHHSCRFCNTLIGECCISVHGTVMVFI